MKKEVYYDPISFPVKYGLDENVVNGSFVPVQTIHLMNVTWPLCVKSLAMKWYVEAGMNGMG